MFKQPAQGQDSLAAVGKIHDIFCGVGIGDSVHTKSNVDGIDKTLDFMDTQTHTFANALAVVECIATSLDQVVNGPSTKMVAKAIVNSFIANQSIFVNWHSFKIMII